MYFEVIYTRCQQGIDLLNAGRPVSSSGFKVYACTPALLENNRVELPFLYAAVQAKPPYSDPGFKAGAPDLMEDAYLYYVPDKGARFLVDFHPVPVDRTATGNYSHRGGNFVNQVMVDGFTDLYPFELFGDAAVWDAKARGEAYYYEHPPAPLPARDISEPAGHIHIGDIEAFIAEGRAEALQKAVAFLIAQYAAPPENRKYLVIRDSSTEHIELWIAAIEHAFSPRMASAIPFATRMDRFTNANHYAVNQAGAYQQLDRQDPNLRQRNYAMLVGVDTRDKTNAAAARPLANAPFVVLDGLEKRALFEADSSNRYYSFITTFDDAHQDFCREFLQMVDLQTPGAGLFRLLDIYLALDSAANLPHVGTAAKMLAFLGQYQVFACPKLKVLYHRVMAEVPRFLQEEPQSALQVLSWLQAAAQTLRDANGIRQLTELVTAVLVEQVYQKADAGTTYALWHSIRQSEFAAGVAKDFVALPTVERNSAYLKRLRKDDTVALVCVYIDCAAIAGTVKAQDLRTLVNHGLRYCAHEEDWASARDIFEALGPEARNMLLAIAQEADSGYAQFLFQVYLEANGGLMGTDADAQAFLQDMRDNGLDHMYGVTLPYYVAALRGPGEIERGIRFLKKVWPIEPDALNLAFEALDRKLAPGEKLEVNTAALLQRERPQGAACTNSAHIYALAVLDDKHGRKQLVDIYDSLAGQGFPSDPSPNYVRALTGRLLKAQLNAPELSYIVHLFARHPAYIGALTEAIIQAANPKRGTEDWNILVKEAARTQGPHCFDALVDACVDLKQGEKALTQLDDMLESKPAHDYFGEVAAEAAEIIRSQKPASGFGKFFGIRRKDDSEGNAPRK